jgi:hypothetical protein
MREGTVIDEIKIQTSSPNDLAGGRHSLQGDNEQRSRNGFVGSQVFPLSGRSGVNVEGHAASLISPAANNREAATVGNMAVGSPVATSVTPVDRRTIEGSTPGDFRKSGDYVKASVQEIANHGGPRQQVEQFPNGGKCKSAPAPAGFPGDAD